MKKLLFILLMLLVSNVNGISYLKSGTQVLTENVTYTFISDWDLSGITIFDKSNNLNISVGNVPQRLICNVSCVSCSYDIIIRNNKYASGYFWVLRDGVRYDNFSFGGTTLIIHGYSSSENQYIIEGYQESNFTYEGMEKTSNLLQDIVNLLQTIIVFIISISCLAIVGYIVIFISSFIKK